MDKKRNYSKYKLIIAALFCSIPNMPFSAGGEKLFSAAVCRFFAFLGQLIIERHKMKNEKWAKWDHFSATVTKPELSSALFTNLQH